MLTEQAIDEMFKWSAWEIIQTKYGPRHRRGCKAGQSEIRMFHLNKMDLTGAGVNLAEFPPMSGKYSLTQWKKVASEEIQRHELQTHLSESAKSSLIIPCPAGLSYMPFQCASVHFALNGLGVDCSPLIPGSQPHPNAFSGLFGMPMIPVQQRRTGFLFADEMGLGKQQPVDSLVMTPSGWKEIGSINVGDFVIGSDGKKTRVNGVFPQGLKKNYRVTFSDGTSVEAGDEHLWTVSYWCGGRWRKNLTLTTQQLRERPKVGRLDLSKIDLYLPMLSAPVTFDPPQALPIDAFTLGAMLSNGSLTGHSARISCNALDLEHFKSRLAHSAFDTVEGSSRLTVPGMMPAVRSLKINVRSGKKSIPRICFTASVRDRIDLFHGLMDGDGSVSKDGTRLTYSTTSKRLAIDMIELVEGLGGIASMKEYDRTHEGKPIEYSVRIRTPACVPPFSSPRKLGKYKPGSHALPTRSVVSVEYSRTVESVCIAVAAPDRLYLTEHCILTHNTVQAIGLVNAMNALGGGKKVGKILYICPAYLKINNVRELSRWLTERYSIGIADGSVFPSTDIVVINYQILHKWEERLSQMWDIVFVDEAQNLRNDTARMTKAAYGYRKKGENRSGIPSKIRIAMTGTPVVNRPKEFWTTLHWLDPITWSDESRFHWKYCGGSLGNGWTNKGSSSELELQKKLRSTLMIRRLKKDVLTELPPKRREVIVLPNDEDLQLSFNTLEMSEWADRMSVARAKVEWMKTKEDRNEYTAAVQQLQDAIDSGQSATSPVRIATAKKKLPLVIPMLEQAAEDCGKILVFAYHRQIIEALQKALPGSLVIYGGIDSQSRDELVQRFQNDPTVTTAILSIPTAVGMTMTAASNVYFVEEDWTPGNISQAEDRCIAEGQLILTPDGWRKIEDIKVGDYVIDGAGDRCQVTDAWSSGSNKLMTEIIVEGWPHPIVSTHDHRFAVSGQTDQWVNALDLKPGMRLKMPSSTRIDMRPDIAGIEFPDSCRISDTFTGSKGVQRNGRLIKAPGTIQVTDDFLFACGYFTGDGFASVSGDKGRFLSFSGNAGKKAQSMARCRKWADSVGISTSSSEDNSGPGVENRSYSGEWAKFFKLSFGGNAHTKQLPQWIMELNRKQSLIVLEGMIASDGYVRRDRVEYSTVSGKLAAQCATLMVRCGKRPCVTNPKQAGGYVIAYSNSQNTQDSLVREVKHRYPRKKQDMRERVYDITVNSTSSFVTGMSVAHNCHRIGQRDSVNVHHLVLENSIDIVMVDQVLRKQKMIDNVLDVDQQRGRDEKEPVIPIPGFSTTFKAIQEEAEKSGHLVQETIQEANRVLENSDALTLTDFELLSRFLKLPAPWPKMVGLIRLLLKSLNTPKAAPKPVTPSIPRQAIERPRSTSSQGELTLA